VAAWDDPTRGASVLEPLLAATTLVDSRWFARFLAGKEEAERRGVLPAWQELPSGAEVSLTSLRAYTGVDLPIIFLSYPWLSREHPDPTGVLFASLLPLLEACNRYCDSEAGGAGASFGVFVDFMALPQRGYSTGYDADHDDRTAEQIERFRRGLGTIGIWYSARHTYTVCLDGELPAGAANTTPYSRRGWCLFERMLASLVKNCNCLLQLSSLDGRLRGANSEWAWFDLISQAAAKRPPPLPPDQFEGFLLSGVEKEEALAGSGIKFTCGKDLTDVVIPQYAESFLSLLGAARALDFSSLGWTDADGAGLAAALSYAATRGALSKLEKLDLYNNDLTGATVLTLWIGNTHHDERAAKGPLGGEGRHHWTCYVEARLLGQSAAQGMQAIEWVEFELHPTFKNRFRMVTRPKSGTRFEFQATGWGCFDIGLKVKLAPGQAGAEAVQRPHAFTHELCFDEDAPETYAVYHAVLSS